MKQGRAVLYVIVQSIIRLRIRTWSGKEGKQGIGSYTYRTCRTYLKSTRLFSAHKCMKLGLFNDRNIYIAESEVKEACNKK